MSFILVYPWTKFWAIWEILLHLTIFNDRKVKIQFWIWLSFYCNSDWHLNVLKPFITLDQRKWRVGAHTWGLSILRSVGDLDTAFNKLIFFSTMSFFFFFFWHKYRLYGLFTSVTSQSVVWWCRQKKNNRILQNIWIQQSSQSSGGRERLWLQPHLQHQTFLWPRLELLWVSGRVLMTKHCSSAFIPEHEKASSED